MPFRSVNITMDWAGAVIMAAFKFKFQISSQLWEHSVIYLFFLPRCYTVRNTRISSPPLGATVITRLYGFLLQYSCLGAMKTGEEKPKRTKDFDMFTPFSFFRLSRLNVWSGDEENLWYCMISTLISKNADRCCSCSLQILLSAPVVKLLFVYYTVETEGPHIFLCHIQ